MSITGLKARICARLSVLARLKTLFCTTLHQIPDRARSVQASIQERLKKQPAIYHAKVHGPGAGAQGPGAVAVGAKSIGIGGNVSGNVTYSSIHLGRTTPLYQDTFVKLGPLRDRKKLLKKGYEALSPENHYSGVWISANASRGKSRLAVSLASRCLGLGGEFQPLFDDSIYNSQSSDCDSYYIDLFKNARKAFQAGKASVLFVIDEVEWPWSEKERLKSFFDNLPFDCRAIVASNQLDDKEKRNLGEKWYLIELSEPLEDQDDMKTFVEEFVEEQECDEVEDELKAIGEEHWSQLWHETQGDVGKLLAVLEGMMKQKPFSEALKEADKPIEERVEEAMKELKPESLRVLKALLFFADSASLEMLKCILGFSSEELKPLLGELIQRSLVEIPPTRDEAKRYKLVSEKAEAIKGQCEQVKDVFSGFVGCWLNYAGSYGQKQYQSYPKLSREHSNLMGVLDELGRRAIDQPKDEKKARQYFKMRKYLRDYLRYEGRWTDFRDYSVNAYEVARELGKKEDAAQAAYDAAWSYSLEGWCGEEELKKARIWIRKMEDLIDEDDPSEKWRAAARKMWGVLATRCDEYESSLDHFKRALCLFKECGQSDEIREEVENVHFYLAKSEMCLSPDSDGESCYEKAMRHLEEALESAKNREENGKENQALIKTKMAELMIWWGKWTKAEQALGKEEEGAVPLSEELGRKDLLAKALYLLAFIHQHESESVSDRDEKLEWLDEAIQSAEDSLENLSNARKGQEDAFLLLCSTYLLLAGLHCSRYEISSDAKDEDACQSYLGKANWVLGFRDYGIGAEYEKACSEALAGNLDEASDLLFKSLETRLGWCKRAQSDFRLASLRETERWWKFIEEKTPKVIGRRNNP